MENEDVDILVCTLTTTAQQPVYGSLRANCAGCGLPVWVSQSGQKAMKDRKGLTPFCIKCAQLKISESDEKPTAEIVPGAIDELKRYFLKINEN